MRRRPTVLAVLAALAALALSACGGSHHAATGTQTRDSAKVQNASLILDFTPNAVHVGIYTALARHIDTAEGLRLHVEVPGASTDAISELQAGRVNYAILDIHDLAIARARGVPIEGILPIVQRPLASIVAAPQITSPAKLQGHTVGVTGDPSDLAVLHSEVAGAGGDPAKVRTIDIGYNAVADLLSGRVLAATAFWNDEGLTVRRRWGGRGQIHVFRVDDFGAPSYPELVVCATTKSLRADPQRARALVATLTRGYQYAIAHPSVGEHDLESEVSGLDPTLVSAELPGLIGAFTGPEHRFGAFDLPLLEKWSRWEAHFGIVKTPPDVATTFDTAFTSTIR